MGYEMVNLPPQQIPFRKKTKEWRKKHLDWADSKTFFNYSLVRKSVIHKRINYDLVNGRLHMKDMEMILNPENIQAGYVPDRIQHYPIINSKLNVLKGEESKRTFDFRVVVTNPNTISEIGENKKKELLNKLQQIIQNEDLSKDEYEKQINDLNDYFTYTWQDLREVRANALLGHYIKELDVPSIFNAGFMDAMIVGEEIYKCDIVGGEPTLERLNPLKVRVFKAGYSNRIEDSDIIILEDYWSPGRVIDTYYDVLSKEDREYIENLPDHIGQSAVDGMDNIDERYGYVNNNMVDDEMSSNGFFFDPFNMFSDSISNTLLPYDTLGNIRVLQVYWKSRRRIKKVKSYDQETGEEIYNFYDEDYIIDKDKGEEQQIFYINQAWEGVKIGQDVYVNMRPRPIQYNRLSNPSRCHFGIIGNIYNINESKPFSLVDMMKPYNYLYNAIHDRLNKLIAKNWGKIITIDLAKVPTGWDIEKWLYFAKTNNIAVVDSFKEANYGAATGTIAGALNNASSGVIDAEVGNIIQQDINLLEFIKMEMSEVGGISKQREGQISNRETVGGVERSTLQSSYITEWLFTAHDNLKKRVLEAFLETAKIAFRGRSTKFQYILDDKSQKIFDIDGDEFAESDYGLVVDNSDFSQSKNAELMQLAQAAMQNQTVSLSSVMKIYGSQSLAEKQRMIENDEKKLQDIKSQEAQQQQQMQQQQLQAAQQLKEAELKQKEDANILDNQTKLAIAQMQAQAQQLSNDGIEEPIYTEEAKANLMEKMREFDERLRLDKDKLAVEKSKINNNNK